MDRALDGFLLQADDEHQQLLSELLAQAFPRFGDHEQVALDRLEAGRRAVGGGPADQLQLLRALCRRLAFIAAKPGWQPDRAWASYEELPDFHHMGLLRTLLGRLLQRRLPCAEEDLLELLALAQQDPRLPLLGVLEHLGRLVQRDGLSPRVEQALRQSRARCGDRPGQGQIVRRLDELLGQRAVAPPAELGGGEPWTDDVRGLAAEDPAWQALVDHAMELGDQARPGLAWLEAAARLVDAVGVEALCDTLVRWLELLAQTPTALLPRSQRLLEGSAGHALRGLVWCCALPDVADRGLVEALGRAAAACFVKVEGRGPRSARVGTACVQVLGALSGAGHGAARELRQVQRNVDYPSARAVIQRALVDATGIRQLSAAQPSALRRAPAPAPPATPPGSADELLVAIYRSPADDELRLAYADRLSRAGDPRGELIALQLQPRLDPTRRRRVQQLLAAHARHWLGELRPALREEGLCYSRGFPVAGQLDLRTPEQAARLQGHPAWSTFESLELAGYCPSGFLTPAIFPALRELSGVGVELGLELCDAAEPWQLSSLQLARPLPFDEQRGHDLQQVAILARSRGLPELRHLGLPVAATGTEPPPAAFGWLFEGPLSSRLSHLTLQTAEPGPWLVRGLESGLLALELRSPGGEQSLELQRAEDGWSLVARFGALRRPLHGLATTLEPLPEGSLVGLTVTLPRGAVPEEAGLRRLQSQARRLGVPEPCLG